MIENPALVTAWATVAIAVSMGIGGLTASFLIWRGLEQMRRSTEERARERREWVAAERLRHQLAMVEIYSWRKKAMEDKRARGTEGMARLKGLVAEISAVQDGSATN